MTNPRPLIKAVAAVTALANLIGLIALAKSGSDISSVFGKSSSTSSVSSPFSPLDTSLSPLDTGLTTSTSEPTWDLRQSTNPIDDSPTVILSLEAISGRSRMGDSPTLVARCSQKETNVYILWNDFLGSDEVSVTTRIGKGAAQTKSWSLSSDNKATFYPGSAVQLIKALMGADTLVARTTPYSESPVTAVFAIKGLSEKIGPLQAACGWK